MSCQLIDGLLTSDSLFNKFDNDSFMIITRESYTCQVSPLVLLINVTHIEENNTVSYMFNIGDLFKVTVKFTVLSNGFIEPEYINEDLHGATLSANIFNNSRLGIISYYFDIYLPSTAPDIQNPRWGNDRYTITIRNPFTDSRDISVRLNRVPRVVVNQNTQSDNIIQRLIKVLSTNVYPSINIQGQTLIDNTDIGNVIFTIKDIYKYYNIKSPIKEYNTCEYYANPDQIKETIFDKSCPKIVSVVRGKGDNLYAKLDYTFYKLGEDVIGVPLIVFYPNIFLYAMLKYILSRILYGNFSINYLLGKYNNKFLEDLSNSRFCGALPIFTDPESIIYNYNKYFKYDI